MSEVVCLPKISIRRSRLSISVDADLLLGLAQEVLLAGGADEVGVLVAEAHVLERLARRTAAGSRRWTLM